MPKKISNEDLINYLTNECDLELSKSIEDAIKHDETLAKELDQLKELRMLQAETMVPLLNKEMPKQTGNLIESIKEKKTTFFQTFFKLSPIAIIGWLGFATVGTMQVATVTVPTATISIASLDENKSSKFRSATIKEDLKDIVIELEEELLLVRKKLKNQAMNETELKDKGVVTNVTDYGIFIEDVRSKAANAFPKIPDPDYTFQIIDIFKNNNDICVEFEALENGTFIDSKEVCFQQK